MQKYLFQYFNQCHRLINTVTFQQSQEDGKVTQEKAKTSSQSKYIWYNDKDSNHDDMSCIQTQTDLSPNWFCFFITLEL